MTTTQNVNTTKHTQKKPKLSQGADRACGLVAFYDIRPENKRVYSFNPKPLRKVRNYLYSIA